MNNWQSAVRAFRKAWRQGDEPPAAALDIHAVRDREYELTRQAQSLVAEQLQWHAERVANDQASGEQRWESFLLLLTRHRRYKDLSQGMQLCRQHRKVLERYTVNHMLRFLALHTYSVLLKETEDSAHIAESIRLARESLKLLPDYPGALHNLAGGLLRQANLAPVIEPRRQAALEEALTHVEQAILQDPHYPKYYATRARIFGMLKRHDEAERDIRFAIDAEDSRQEDYAIRLSEYLDIKSGIALGRTTSHIQDEIAAASREVLADARRGNIQILTIFIAVISFLIGGLTLTASFPFAEAAKLVFLLAAAMLLALTGFGILYEGTVNAWRLGVALGVALGLLVLAHVVPVTLAWG